jgi:phosphoribosylpyrophosphate synthetase
VNEHTTAGPLLSNLLSAHRAAERATTYQELSSHAASLAMLCDEMGSPVVWPVGAAAERLAGASVLASEGDVRVRGWTDDIRGESVLLVSVAAVTPLSMVEAAKHARAMGAFEVHACGIEVAGLEMPELSTVFDSCAVLSREVATF